MAIQGKKAHKLPLNPLSATIPPEGETTLTRVHVTSETVATFEMTPSHSKRVQTPLYEKSRRYLIDTQDTPCLVCGVRASTLHDQAKNRFGATAMETHHYPIERSLVNACDPAKVHLHFPQVIDQMTLETFADSPSNLLVLCSTHHRSLEQGIHHLMTQDFAILPFLYQDYQIVANARDKDAMLVANQALEDARKTKGTP